MRAGLVGAGLFLAGFLGYFVYGTAYTLWCDRQWRRVRPGLPDSGYGAESMVYVCPHGLARDCPLCAHDLATAPGCPAAQREALCPHRRPWSTCPSCSRLPMAGPWSRPLAVAVAGGSTTSQTSPGVLIFGFFLLYAGWHLACFLLDVIFGPSRGGGPRRYEDQRRVRRR
jgi:hypothetical protein